MRCRPFTDGATRVYLLQKPCCVLWQRVDLYHKDQAPSLTQTIKYPPKETFWVGPYVLAAARARLTKGEYVSQPCIIGVPELPPML